MSHDTILPVVVLSMWMLVFTRTVFGQTQEQQMSPGHRVTPVSLQKCIQVYMLILIRMLILIYIMICLSYNNCLMNMLVIAAIITSIFS